MLTKDELKERRIAVLLGGFSSERAVSLKSGQAVLGGLRRKGYNATAIDVDRNLLETLKTEKTDIAYIALHGRFGEDGTVQGLLEMAGIPYTGPGVLGSALSMDKCLGKLVLKSLDVPTPSYKMCTSEIDSAFPLPFVVKPAREGSTVGISIVRNADEIDRAIRTAFTYDTKVLIESFVQGKEITVAVVNGNALPIVEVRPKSGFYDYESKYSKGKTDYFVPADLSLAAEERARQNALKIYRHFDLAGCVRIDMIVADEVPEVIDINTSPGMTETSLVPMAWNHLGKTFDDLTEEVLMGAALKA